MLEHEQTGGARPLQTIRLDHANGRKTRRVGSIVCYCAISLGLLGSEAISILFEQDNSPSRTASISDFVSSAHARGRRGGGGGGGGNFSRSPERRETEQKDSSRSSQDESRTNETRSESERRSDSTDSKRESDENKDSKSARGKSSERENSEARRDDSRPPSTLVEAFERLLKPDGPKSAPSVTKTGHGANPSTAALLPIGTKSYSGGEVLAVNLSAAAIARARLRGFDVNRTSSLAQLKSSITRLVPPPGMDAAQARMLLQADLPSEQFALNRIYRVYRAANQGIKAPAQRTAPARTGGTAVCEGDRCAGRQAIHWKDKLQGCSKGLRVGMIDTDVDLQHPAFTSGRLKIGSFLPEGRSSAPNWHGTGVLALMAGDPKSGTPGLIPQSDFYVANVFFADDTGDFATDTVSLLKAFDWMTAFDVKLINMSFTGPKDELVQKAIAGMSAKGVVFVAAAGNDGPVAPPGYPAAYKQVVAVTAVNRDLRNFPYSNRGNHIDVSAPGVDIWTAVPGSKEGYHTGTSFAAPYVTAILATVLKASARRQKEDLIGQLPLVDLGAPGRDPIYGRGLLIAPDGCQPAAIAASSVDRPISGGSAPTAASWTPAPSSDRGRPPAVAAGFK